MTPLKYLHPDTLPTPGPVGRGARLVMGLLSGYALVAIIFSWATTTPFPATTLDERVLLLLAPLCVFNYVVNIGFGLNWRHWPLLGSMLMFALAAVGAVLVTGRLDSPILGLPLNIWLAYFYAHLGVSFLLSALLATPGCEMRSIPELLGRLRGRRADEHPCPVAFLSWLDGWENRRH